MSTTMSREAREAFLADLHVGIVSVEQRDGPPITVPVWYSFEPGGEVRFITQEGSRKARALRAAGRFSLCAQTESPPYRYVSVQGSVISLDPVDVEEDLRPMARRYLGQGGGDQYVADNGGATAGKSSLLVRMRPSHWYSADYGPEL